MNYVQNTLVKKISKHQFSSLLFGSLFFAAAVAKAWINVPWWFFLTIPLVYLAITFTGSYFIGWNYFFQSLNHGNRQSNKIAVTFDDAPMNPETVRILDILKANNVKALFFLIGKQIRGNEHLLKRIIDEGHIIGNHSFSHENSFPFFSPQKMVADMQHCDEVIEAATGKKPKLFRPPFGVTNPRLATAVKTCGYVSVGWSLRSYDTAIKNRNKLLKRCLVSLRGGDIVLFHDWGIRTAEILPEWIAEVRKRGLEIVRADELLEVEVYR